MNSGVRRKDYQLLLHMCHRPCYSCYKPDDELTLYKSISLQFTEYIKTTSSLLTLSNVPTGIQTTCIFDLLSSLQMSSSFSIILNKQIKNNFTLDMNHAVNKYNRVDNTSWQYHFIKREVHKTSLTPPLFIEMPVPSKERKGKRTAVY